MNRSNQIEVGLPIEDTSLSTDETIKEVQEVSHNYEFNDDRDNEVDEDDYDDSDNDEIENISIREGLSSETLQALFGFMKTLGSDPSTLEEDSGIASASVASADVDKNSGGGCGDNIEDLAAAIEGINKIQDDPPRSPLNLECEANSSDNVSAFKRDGVIRINNVLSSELCDSCLSSINSTLLRNIDAGSDHFSSSHETGFGNVDSKEHRWDMYMRYDGAVEESLLSIFKEPNSELSSFFRDLLGGNDAEFHELSALVSDMGAFTQRIHADTLYQEFCPVITVFIALQDISVEMGPTIFLPKSHSKLAHHKLRFARSAFLSSCEYRQALLKKGDVAIMDSRTLHCGDANSEKRRCLLYFSLINPLFSDMGGGSMFKDLSLTLEQVQSGKTNP